MSNTVRYLSSEDVAALMPPMKEVVEIVEQTLHQHGEGKTSMPPKVDVGGLDDDAFLHAMPAHVRDQAALGIKWVAGYPNNPEKGLPYIHGTMILNDPDTGRPLAFMDAAQITAVRTGACTAVTAKHLADPNSEVMTIIGCGVQGRVNIEALLAVFPDTERMLAYDIDPSAQEKFADEVMTTFDLASIIPPDAEEACVGGHVIVTATPILKEPKPFIEPAFIQTGTLCVSLDFDAAFDQACFDGSDLCITDDLAQFEHYQQHGHFVGYKSPTDELGKIVCGAGAKRPDGTPIVMAANLGLGVLDVALAKRLLSAAEAAGRGVELPL
ncbi:MAG: alanine dehydrogenase [Planctomycetota bacterium]|nr:MAG: alanine dehydrogenase [Planctomycetota bacterium]